MNINESVIMAFAGTVSALFWLFLFIRGNGKYSEIIKTKAAKELRLHEIFFTGFELMKILKINVRSGKCTEKRKNISEIYGQRYAEFYTYLFTGAQISYAALLFPVSLLAGAASGSLITALLGTAASVLMLFVLDGEVRKKTLEKHEEIMCELPDVIMRLNLLINAGMVLRDAWSMIAESSDTALGREMKQTSSDIRNGMPETDAFNLFAERCRTKEIRKFAGSLVQNIKKGSAGLSESLQQLADEQWDEKKNYVRKKAASSEQKLLFPMLMIFVSIIMMIVVPVFTNML